MAMPRFRKNSLLGDRMNKVNRIDGIKTPRNADLVPFAETGWETLTLQTGALAILGSREKFGKAQGAGHGRWKV